MVAKKKLTLYDKRIIAISKQIAPPNTNGCWEWQGHIHLSTGYGRCGWQGSAEGAHRVMWKIVHGSIPKNLCVLHKCDNPPCCNPAHLFLGTHKDNMKDRKTKNRYKSRRLNFEIATTIRKSNPKLSDIPALSEQYDVTPNTIYNIIRGKSYTGNRKKRKKNTKKNTGIQTTRHRKGRKLTFLQAERIRDVYKYRNHTYPSLALMYHVNEQTIHRIINHITWKTEVTQ